MCLRQQTKIAHVNELDYELLKFDRGIFAEHRGKVNLDALHAVIKALLDKTATSKKPSQLKEGEGYEQD